MDTKPSRFELRLPADLAAAIDAWRRSQPDIPDRAEAARRLMRTGLSAHDAREAAKHSAPPPPDKIGDDEKGVASTDTLGGSQDVRHAPPRPPQSAVRSRAFVATQEVTPRFKTGKLPIPPRRL